MAKKKAKREQRDIIISEQRGFEGVWIPKKLYITNKFNLRTKFFVVEIKSLSKKGYCYATDKHFADFLGISERMVQIMIKQLKEDNYLTAEYEYEKDTQAIKRRFLILTDKFYNEFYNEKAEKGAEKDFSTPPEKDFAEPIEENFNTGSEKNCGEKYNSKTKYNNDLSNTDSSVPDNYTSKDMKRLSFEDNMYTSVPEEQEEHTKKPSRYIPPDYTEEQLREHIRPTIEENYEQIEQEYDVIHKPDGKKLIEDITVEFFRQYEDKYGVKHRILPDKSYINVLERFISSRDDILDGFEIDEYRIMIEHYFKTNFDKMGSYGKKITLSLSHFISYKILKFLTNREGILWERCEDEE